MYYFMHQSIMYVHVKKILQNLNRYSIKTNVAEKLSNYKWTISTSTSLRKKDKIEISKLNIFCNKEIFIAYPFSFKITIWFKRYHIYSSIISGFYTIRTCNKNIFVIFKNKCIKNVKLLKRHDEKIVYSKKSQKNKRNIELLPNINANENAFDSFSFLKSIYLMKIKFTKWHPLHAITYLILKR